MDELLRILILEDRSADAELIQFELEEAGLPFTAKVVMTEKDYICELQECSPDLILSDYDLPSYNGSLALAEAGRRCPDTPFILVTGAVSEDRAIEILTQGAKDYVLKSRLQQRLVPAIRRALAEAEEHRARKQAEAELRESYRTMEERVEIRTAELEAEMMTRKKLQEELRESESRESKHFIELRRKAQVRMKMSDAMSGASGVQVDTQKLLQELQIYQIELEILNEELRESKNEADALLAKYLDVYDFAPIGYFTLNADGIILQVNLTGARLLGVERSCLTGRKFRSHVSDKYYPTFDEFLRKTYEGETIESCELMLSRKEGAPSFFVQLEARLSEDKKECNLVMIDIAKRKLCKD
jgi:PAS domain S-box-containing protein